MENHAIKSLGKTHMCLKIIKGTVLTLWPTKGQGAPYKSGNPQVCFTNGSGFEYWLE